MCRVAAESTDHGPYRAALDAALVAEDEAHLSDLAALPKVVQVLQLTPEPIAPTPADRKGRIIELEDAEKAKSRKRTVR